MTSRINLSSLILPQFNPVHYAIKRGTHGTIWMKGGRGSLKSTTAAIEIIVGMMADRDANAVVVRKVAATMRQSVLASLEWAIDKLGVQGYFHVTKNPASITYLPTGQMVVFYGLDDPLKLKSIKVKRGYFKFLWWEEGQEYDGPEEMRSVRQSVLRGGPAAVEIVTYNPPPETYHWINKEAAIPREDRLVHHSCYLDVPSDWLGAKFLKDAEDLKREDPVKYANEYLGEMVGNSQSLIFARKVRIEEFTPGADWNGPYYGCDWGFAQDPTCITRSWVHDSCLWVEYDVRGIGISLDDHPALFNLVPGADRYRIRADSARPETIDFMRRRGFDVVAAEKGPGSVEEGITFLLSYRYIILHPRCEGIIEESRKYSYKVDKLTKDILPDIVDKDNHGFDALRYGIEPIMKKRIGFFS
jgi:PBSX family phage terminase large subunit